MTFCDAIKKQLHQSLSQKLIRESLINVRVTPHVDFDFTVIPYHQYAFSLHCFLYIS